MALEIGTRFGPYEVLAPAGAGGMGGVPPGILGWTESSH